MAGEQIGLNHVDRESENVSDETISESESSDKEINLVSKKIKRKKDRKGRKSTWKESAIGDLVNCIRSSKYAERKLMFTNNKATKNGEIYQKTNSKVRTGCEEKGELYEHTLGQTKSELNALVSICNRTAILCKLCQKSNTLLQKKFMGYSFLLYFH